MKTIFSSFVDDSFRVLKSQGETGFDYIADQTGLASVDAVLRLKAACESHLQNLTQEEIDIELSEWRRQGLAPTEYPTKEEPTGFVYLMLNRRNGFVKIGFSKDPKHREKTLQSEEPEIELIAKIAGTWGDEQSLHAKFSSRRIRGEWFNLTETQIAELRQDHG